MCNDLTQVFTGGLRERGREGGRGEGGREGGREGGGGYLKDRCLSGESSSRNHCVLVWGA
jgi:hypothetical protein